jgi:hypothetical protein
VCAEVWDLYRDAWTLGGPFPTVIEWDDNLPSWARLVEEATSARRRRGSDVARPERIALEAA